MPSDYIRREDALRVCKGIAQQHRERARQAWKAKRFDEAVTHQNLAPSWEGAAKKIQDLPADPLLAAQVAALIEALFVFADEGEEIHVGDFTISAHSGDVADDDVWLVVRDCETSGLCYADFDQAVLAALREQEQDGEIDAAKIEASKYAHGRDSARRERDKAERERDEAVALLRAHAGYYADALDGKVEMVRPKPVADYLSLLAPERDELEGGPA